MNEKSTCGCGHEHDHEHEHTHEHDEDCCCHEHEHEHGHKEEFCKIDGCSCGCGESEDHSHEHGDGCGHDHDNALTAKWSKQIAIAGAVLIAVSAIFALMGYTVASIAMAAGTVMVGYPLFVSGVKSLLRFKFDELTLMTVAVSASFCLAATSADPFEGVVEAAAVTVLFRIGNLLESRAIRKSKREIEALTKIRPDSATVINADGSQSAVPAESVKTGSVIFLRAGDRVPIDCEVLSGGGFIDLSAITGESIPVQASQGMTLPSGAINTDGMLTCKTINSFEDSTASRIIRMVRESAEKKGATETFISRFAGIYTPLMMAMAAALAIVPPFLGLGPFSMWLSRALVFLVASCPCALVISVPLTFFAGVGASSKAGVLVKGTKYIEILSKTDCVVMDKTGTLTQGTPVVSGMEIYGEFEEKELLAIAKSAEKGSNHPAAKAITEYAKNEAELSVSDYIEHPGMGVELMVDGRKVICGSKMLLEKMRVLNIQALPEDGICLAVEGTAACSFSITDMLRPEAVNVIARLRSLGIGKIAMLTGDNAKTASRVAEELGIDYRAQLLPEQKLEHFKTYKGSSAAALFVGDGINDAPTLISADAGVAMGFGSDTAIEAADVVLMRENLTALTDAIKIAKKTMGKAWFNIVFSLGIKAAVLLLGAMGIASMWMAVFADVGVSIIAVLNAVTVLAYKRSSDN